ncbi:MAG: hypothetical protein ACRCZ2_10090 [Fusobacteriaceae bacterium]
MQSNLSTQINQSLTLELVINLKELKRQGSRELINRLIDYDCELYLESKETGLSYLFNKKHNQHKNLIILQGNQGSFLYPDGSETLNSNFNFGGEFFTISGQGKVISNQSINNDSYDYLFTTNTVNSQTLANKAQLEEVSIAGQSLSDDILKLTFFSGISKINNVKNNLVYGETYKDRLSNILNLLLPNFEISIDIDKDVSYSVEAKTNLEILEDLLTNQIFIDGGFDLNTNTQRIKIFNAVNQSPKHRLVSYGTYNSDNPAVLSVRENYPSLSSEIVNYKTYIQEGDLCVLDYNTETTNYKGNFIFEGTSFDLLYRIKSDKSTVSLLKTNRDVRKNYLTQNLETLSNQLIN